MVLKKVLAMVLTKYFSLQTLQGPTTFQVFRWSIESRLARRKAGPVIRSQVGRGRRWRVGRRAVRIGNDLAKIYFFIEELCFRSI